MPYQLALAEARADRVRYGKDLVMRFLSLRVLLRSAAIASLLYCLGHTSGFPWTPGTGERASAVVQQMQTIRFEAEGVTRTYWDFYLGFGIIISVFLAGQALSLWCIERLGKPARLAPLLGVFLLGALVNAYLSYRYFFALPAIFSVVIALLLGLAIQRALNASPAAA
jgi:hypothetical protein